LVRLANVNQVTAVTARGVQSNLRQPGMISDAVPGFCGGVLGGMATGLLL
jgi:hypothetical protein